MPRAIEIRNSDGQFYGVQFRCPGCGHDHTVPTKNGSRGEMGWEWNGSLDTPTLSPSILVHAHGNQTRCHSYVRDGRIQFLGDCGHALVNQTADLPEVGP